jgi:hypothetical protein
LHRFWNSVIKPVFVALEPRVIVEIGADRGRNTANVLEYCRRTDSVAHVIDPLPKFNIKQWQQEWSEAIFHQQLSLDALPTIGAMDVVLIDGDHNWYTVFNELKLLEKIAGCVDRFPLVLLHDVEWPYDRRDSYHAPATIPSRYRHPYAKLGIRPGKSELVEERGLNAGFMHAVYENTPRNGVLTAVEDFLSESHLDCHVVVLPGMHGLGILATRALLRRNQKLAQLLASFDTKEFLTRHCRDIERARIRTSIRGREKRKLMKRRVRELEKRVADAHELARAEAELATDMPSTSHEGGSP